MRAERERSDEFIKSTLFGASVNNTRFERLIVQFPQIINIE